MRFGRQFTAETEKIERKYEQKNMFCNYGIWQEN
jgi:hypothetical protein